MQAPATAGRGLLPFAVSLSNCEYIESTREKLSIVPSWQTFPYVNRIW